MLVRAARYVRASLLLLGFYWRFVFRFGEIHPALPSGRLLGTLAAAGQPAPSLKLGGSFKHEFNDGLVRLKARLRELLPPCRFEAVLAGSWSVRALWAAAVWASMSLPVTSPTAQRCGTG